MFDQLFERPHALARQLSAPLVEERRRYLCHCHTQEFSRSSLRLTAQLLVATAEYLRLDDRPSAIITLQEVEEAGSRWSQRVSLPPIENPRLSRQRFVHSATGWLPFLGRLEIPSTPGKPYDPLVADFAEFLRNLGKLALQICRQAVDDLCAPAFPLLPIEDVAANLPIQKDELAVDSNRGAQLRCLTAALQVC